MKNTDDVEDIEEIAAESQCSDDLPDTTPFTFGYPLDEDGTPDLGDGSDDEPLVIGATTKFLLEVATWDPDTFVFHKDATFELVTCGYPFIVCGISDAARQFHPMAFFLTSQRTLVQYCHALRRLMDIYKVVVGRPLVGRYCIGDAEDAQLNGVEQTLFAPCASEPSKPELQYLMCFFHVVENVKKRVLSLSKNSKYLVYRHIYEMHYARDATEFMSIQERADGLWQAVPEMKRFADYFIKTWIKMLLVANWLCENEQPMEQFNKVIKRDYTFRVRTKLCALLKKVVSMCHHRSILPPTFATKPKPATTLIARTKRLLKAKKIVVTQPRHTVQFLLEGESNRPSGFHCRSLIDTLDNVRNVEEQPSHGATRTASSGL
ncbi:hypothetical protein AM587_10000926 [Phytophthora nicotianae]|uniref:MULE transposase domain-containing protein n=2 Tax=Phytophthora nicotianae TaxID=4792 RepID=A0A0W8C7R4_PHYNI|nr:hypothetical protein AM587_10000926 [Phytophthora nicotianae]